MKKHYQRHSVIHPQGHEKFDGYAAIRLALIKTIHAAAHIVNIERNDQERHELKHLGYTRHTQTLTSVQLNYY